MVYTELTNKALRFAYNAHHGQLDYNGIPYIFHPVHLAEQMDDEISCCAALLHDVAEDTEFTLKDLAKEFPPEVVQVLSLLTLAEGIPYFDYVRAIKSHPVAKKVKLADIAHNSDQTRCIGSDLTREQLDYWRQKYQKALQILMEED